MCVFFHAPAGGTAVFYFVGGGRRRVPGLSTHPEVCDWRVGMEAREARIHGSMEMRCGQRILIQRI